MRKIAIILAGGEGHRAGGDMPKQFREVGGRPMYQWSLMRFREADPSTEILFVCHPGAFDLVDILDSEWGEERVDYRLICGGRTRRESVANALMEVEADDDTLVAVHDSARPLVDVEMIRRGWECARDNGTAVPVVPVTDSLRHLEPDGSSRAVVRSEYVAVQTPQVFTSRILKEAYSLPDDAAAFTDDASMVQACGIGIRLYDGNPDNMKVTVASDFIVADALLARNG